MLRKVARAPASHFIKLKPNTFHILIASHWLSPRSAPTCRGLRFTLDLINIYTEISQSAPHYSLHSLGWTSSWLVPLFLEIGLAPYCWGLQMETFRTPVNDLAPRTYRETIRSSWPRYSSLWVQISQHALLTPSNRKYVEYLKSTLGMDRQNTQHKIYLQYYKATDNTGTTQRTQVPSMSRRFQL